VQEAVFDAGARFFALPADVKMDLRASKATGFKGYDVMASQSYQTDVLPDLKEGFVCGVDLPEGDPRRSQDGRFFTAQNIWPSEALLAPHEFQEPVVEYAKAMVQLCGVVLDLLAATLTYGPAVFDDFKANEPACPLRLLHYPPTPMTGDPNRPQLGSSAHTDFGAITLLLQDEHEGLEVLDQATGQWRLVPPNKDAYVVNLGDMMSKITGGVYKSSMHRVVNRNKTDRYSVVFFFDGNRDYKLKPLGLANMNGNEDGFMTAEEYMLDRLRFSYGRHEANDGA
jgi:isopenicillin N synthase-like dioxygenase